MTKIQKIVSFGTALGTLLAVSPLSALAQNPINIVPQPPFDAIGNITVGRLVTWIITMIFITAGVMSFIFLLWGGVQWILAGGDKEGTEKARKRITAALIGLAIVFSAYALSLLVQGFFGVPITNFDIPNI